MIGGEWNEWMRSPASADGPNTTSPTSTCHPRHRRALRTGPRRRRHDPGGAVRPVLRRPRLPVYRPRGPSLDVRHARARREPRRGRGRDQHADPRHQLAVSTRAPGAAAVDLTLAALADPVRRRSSSCSPSDRIERASSPRALGVSPPVMSRHLRRAARPRSWSTRSTRPSTPGCASSRFAAADGRAEGVAGRRRSRVGPAARRVQGPRGATR